MTEKDTVKVTKECMGAIETAVARSMEADTGLLERIDINVRGLDGINGAVKNLEQRAAIRAAVEAVLDTHPACPKGDFTYEDGFTAVVTPNAPQRGDGKSK